MATRKDFQSKTIDQNTSSFPALLEDLQGNILKGHGRDHSVHLFLKLRLDASAVAKEWIRRFAEQYVTSAQKQSEERNDLKQSGIRGGLFANFFLTHKGYERLGVLPPQDPKFVAGMQASRKDLGDPAPANWEKGYRDNIHAAILLAHHRESVLDEEADRIRQEVEAFADIVADERGDAIRNENGQPVEHFGYVDGRSQPLFLQEDIDQEHQDEPGDILYDPATPLDVVLVPDPNGKREEMSYGSYLVFRKLEQNVRGFKEAEEKLARALGLADSEADRKLAAAFIVGRFRDGTPVVRQPMDGLTNPVPNNFNYDHDNGDDGNEPGLRCPLHAHIRRTNPRGTSGQSDIEELHRRIARRGITYGRRQTLEESPRAPVGLLFMCFQSNIENQFEFLQREWANKKSFPPQADGTSPGIDPIIGQPPDPTPQYWTGTWGGGDKRPYFSFNSFVKLKGGEYFFAPSISALGKLSGNTHPPTARKRGQKRSAS